jgi:hypothetical protein
MRHNVIPVIASLLIFWGCSNTSKTDMNETKEGSMFPDVAADGKASSKGATNEQNLRNHTAASTVNIVKMDKGKVVFTVEGSVFTGPKKVGDFEWMYNQPEYARTLFVFNDNEGQFDAFIAGDRGPAGCGRGSGNGALRPLQCKTPRRVAGIPTGKNGKGYPALTEQVKAKIDQGISIIRELAESGNFDKVVFSEGYDEVRNKPTLGTATFAPSMEVRDYIFESLMSL